MMNETIIRNIFYTTHTHKKINVKHLTTAIKKFSFLLDSGKPLKLLLRLCLNSPWKVLK